MKKLLLLYTGGTIGMVQDQKGILVPFDFNNITENVPELSRLDYQVVVISFDPILDSSNMNMDTWIEMASIIEKNYDEYDGFVILHGSDTMAYTASALSFMLENLAKPVILTGSQLPIGEIRTDAKENLITALEIAAAKDEHGHAIVNEVCIYFDYKLFFFMCGRKAFWYFFCYVRKNFFTKKLSKKKLFRNNVQNFFYTQKKFYFL
jgi:L-asparaginase